MSNHCGPFAGRDPRGYRRSDGSISEDVNEYLARYGQIDARQIHVSVDDGEVTLSGTAATREEKRLAEDVAGACPGVKEVRNKLRVNRTEAP
ncbi:MAG: BON domain-containing protein [Blastocatellales bacterium]